MRYSSLVSKLFQAFYFESPFTYFSLFEIIYYKIHGNIIIHVEIMQVRIPLIVDEFKVTKMPTLAIICIKYLSEFTRTNQNSIQTISIQEV